MRLRYAAPARREIRKILADIKTESPRGAARVQERILAAAALIERHPFAGPETDRQGVRRVVLTPFPYVLFYRVMDAEIVVTDVRHTARRV